MIFLAFLFCYDSIGFKIDCALQECNTEGLKSDLVASCKVFPPSASYSFGLFLLAFFHVGALLVAVPLIFVTVLPQVLTLKNSPGER